MGEAASLDNGRAADVTYRPADTLYEGAFLKARLIFPPVSTWTQDASCSEPMVITDTGVSTSAPQDAVSVGDVASKR